MFQSFNNVFGTVLSIVSGVSAVIALLLGGITLFFGRKLFWVFAALIGLAVGFVVAPQLLQNQPEILRIIFVLIIAGVCALLAVFAEKIMIILAGFLGLGLLGYMLISLFKLPVVINWIIFFGLGILGAVLISKYMEWALVVISSLVGAIMVGAGLGKFIHVNFLIDLLIFVALIAVGIFVQSRDLIKTK